MTDQELRDKFWQEVFLELRPTADELVEEVFECFLEVRADPDHPDDQMDRELILRQIDRLLGNEVTKRINTLTLTLIREDFTQGRISEASQQEYAAIYQRILQQPYLAIPSYFYQIYEVLGLTCVENFQWIPRYLPDLSDLIQEPVIEDLPLVQQEETAAEAIDTSNFTFMHKMPHIIRVIFERVINRLLQPYTDHIRVPAGEIQQKVLQNLQVRQRKAFDLGKQLLKSPTQVLNLLSTELKNVMEALSPGISSRLAAPLALRGDTSSAESEGDLLPLEDRKLLMDYLNTTDLTEVID